jgi:hypothetical protein
VPYASTLIPEVLAFPVVENPIRPTSITSTSLSDPYLRVTFAIVAARKVRLLQPLISDIYPYAQVQGHWIQDCPTNNDREFDNRPRIKRTTGIPRSMLKAVDNPSNAQPGQGVMVTPEGGYVVAQPDSWVVCLSRLNSLKTRISERPGKNKCHATKD